jgi:hypothetical protein
MSRYQAGAEVCLAATTSKTGSRALTTGYTQDRLGAPCPCYNLHSPEGFTVEAILMISSVGEFIVPKKALRISAI